MCFESIITQHKEGSIRSVLNKRFVAKRCSHGLRARFHCSAIHDTSAAVAASDADEGRGKDWANLPPELLRSVLMRVESSESTWPSRKQVVACAGVCKSWRAITQEVVRTPQESGRLTFPISLKQPGPRNFLFHCFIKRNRTTKTYCLYLGLTQALNNTGKFLLAACKRRRPTCTEYIISLNARDMSKGAILILENCGSKFTIYNGVPTQMVERSHSIPLGLKQVSSRMLARNYPVAQVVYGESLLRSVNDQWSQEDAMHNELNTPSAMEPGGVVPSQRLSSGSVAWTKHSHRMGFFKGSLPGQKEAMLILQSKAPMWNEQFQCWSLSFQGRVTIPSAKNFQLVASVGSGQSSLEDEGILLQFGKVGKNLFTMDYGYPLSAFQAFAICLSTFRQ